MSNGFNSTLEPDGWSSVAGSSREGLENIKNQHLLPLGPDVEIRLQQIKSANNPLLEAAKPLLLAMAQIHKQQFNTSEHISAFYNILEQEVTTFTTLCHRVNILREHIVAASFCLCTALDEAASSTTWGGGKADQAGAWADNMLASRFHQDIQGGKKFFLLIGRLSQAPNEHLHLLELMYQILCLGFEGQFAGDPQGVRQLETIRHRMLTTITASQEAVPRELSNHWKGVGAKPFALLRSIPVWVTASILGLVVLGLFGWYKYQLLQQSQALEAKILSIGKITPPPIESAPVHVLNLKELLHTEITTGKVMVEEDQHHSAVTFKGDDMFLSGKVELSGKVGALLEKVSREIAKVPGHVKVIGHSDSSPINTPQIPNNLKLSEQRAAHVANALTIYGVDPARIEVIGKGDTEPVSETDLAKNRRVQIVVTN